MSQTMFTDYATCLKALQLYGMATAWAELQAEQPKQSHRPEVWMARLLEAERKLTNSQTRQVKVSNGQPNVVHPVRSVQSVQHLDPVKLEKTRQMIEANPNVTTREISAALGFSSPSSGKTYKDAVNGVTK